MTHPPQQPGPYGQQGPWGQPPQPPVPSQAPPWLTNDVTGFPSFEPDPRESRGGRVAALVIVGLLVLGGGGFGVWLLMSRDSQGAGSGDSEARTVAERYVRDMERTVNTPIPDIDVAPLEPVTCAEDFEQIKQEIDDLKKYAGEAASRATPKVEISMTDFRTTADTASFTLTQVMDGDKSQDHEMTMARERGAWKVCGLFDTQSSPSSQPAEPADPADPTTPDETIRVTATRTAEQDSGENGEEGGGSPGSGPVPNPIPTS
jgi:hypothetical protein